MLDIPMVGNDKVMKRVRSLMVVTVFMGSFTDDAVVSVNYKGSANSKRNKATFVCLVSSTNCTTKQESAIENYKLS